MIAMQGNHLAIRTNLAPFEDDDRRANHGNDCHDYETCTGMHQIPDNLFHVTSLLLQT